MFGTKTIAAAKRGVEVAAGAAIGWLIQAYWGAGDLTLTGAWDTVDANWDAAGGAALIAFLAAFGYTRSPAKNLSTVAENVPPPDGPVVDVKDDAAVAEAEAVAPPDEAA